MAARAVEETIPKYHVAIVSSTEGSTSFMNLQTPSNRF